ncbi:MAG: hypothetical protein L0H64_11690 [Pseudonocardia sp.]|nr:hypothetical protein [Pseudonocardia sp.]
MDVLVSILWYAVPTAALVLLITLLVVVPPHSRKPRYRVGQPWPHQPLWWTANPRGAHLPAPDGRTAAGERGGARGNW